MSKALKNKQPLLPVIVLLFFSLLLLVSLVYRVSVADRDLGIIRLEQKQARLAAESGVNFALTRIHKTINSTENTDGFEHLSTQELGKALNLNKWQPIGNKKASWFRITSIRKTNELDNYDTKLIDESLRYHILSEGRCKGHQYTSSAVIQVYDLAKTFGAFSSLDEFYYGTPIQPWIELGESLDNFIKRNSKLFVNNKMNRFGICQDPELLFKIYDKNQPSPFENPKDDIEIVGNYGKYYEKSGYSPLFGPLYAASPIVVDQHTFRGPIQTAWFFFKRENATANILKDNTLTNLHSSPSIQAVANKRGGRNHPNSVLDKDTDEYNPLIPQWRPNLEFLKELSKGPNGIYIDEKGQGFVQGKPSEVKYHAGEADFYSDSYVGPNLGKLEQDILKGKKYIVLSTANKFNNYNNLDSKNLNGAKILYSERSIFIRGEIEGDLTIVTPGHIFITGPTNIDSNLNLMLIGGQGTAISTVDLENIIKNSQPGEEFVDAVREWIIKAIIYKPGSGIYTTQTELLGSHKVNFRGLFAGKSLKLKIMGACIGGNLTRWIDNTENNSLEIHHLTNAPNRLINRPYSANILKIQTKKEKS
jgi:hypothetical protein